MPHRPFGLVAFFAAAAPALFAEEPISLYMMPPIDLLRASPEKTLVELAASRRVVEPVEARRPARPVEIVMTPVGEMNLSCSLQLVPDKISASGLIVAGSAVDPQSEPVAIEAEPVVAPRPAGGESVGFRPASGESRVLARRPRAAVPKGR